MKISWLGKGFNERCIWNNRTIIKIDNKYFRPTEIESLRETIKKHLKF